MTPVLRMPPAFGLLAAFGLLGLTGCAGPDAAPQPDRVRSAIESLGGTPESILQQSVLSRPPGGGQFRNQIVFLVPEPDGPGFHIVDSYGEIYDSYAELLGGNRFPK
jgi:hypothetical protein